MVQNLRPPQATDHLKNELKRAADQFKEKITNLVNEHLISVQNDLFRKISTLNHGDQNLANEVVKKQLTRRLGRRLHVPTFEQAIQRISFPNLQTIPEQQSEPHISVPQPTTSWATVVKTSAAPRDKRRRDEDRPDDETDEVFVDATDDGKPWPQAIIKTHSVRQSDWRIKLNNAKPDFYILADFNAKSWLNTQMALPHSWFLDIFDSATIQDAVDLLKKHVTDLSSVKNVVLAVGTSLRDSTSCGNINMLFDKLSRWASDNHKHIFFLAIPDFPTVSSDLKDKISIINQTAQDFLKDSFIPTLRLDTSQILSSNPTCYTSNVAVQILKLLEDYLDRI
jgi:hypothetical protein